MGDGLESSEGDLPPRRSAGSPSKGPPPVQIGPAGALPQDNVEKVRRMYAAWARGDFRAGLEDLDPHVTFVVRPEFPEFGVFVGADGVRQFMTRLFEQWERMTVNAERLVEVGDTVLARVVQTSKGRMSGVEGDNRYFMLFTFRGGKVVRLESVIEEADALEAAGLRGFP
jgi:ketosteroid isomerase-like protein